MRQAAEVKHPTTLSVQDNELSLAQMDVSEVKTTSEAALSCYDVSNRFVKITHALKKVAQLPAASWPLEPKTCGETTFLRASAEEQVDDVTALGQLRDEDTHRAVSRGCHYFLTTRLHPCVIIFSLSTERTCCYSLCSHSVPVVLFVYTHVVQFLR